MAKQCSICKKSIPLGGGYMTPAGRPACIVCDNCKSALDTALRRTGLEGGEGERKRIIDQYMDEQRAHGASEEALNWLQDEMHKVQPTMPAVSGASSHDTAGEEPLNQSMPQNAPGHTPHTPTNSAPTAGGLYGNVGKKIKGLATTLVVLGIVASFIVGIVIIATERDYARSGTIFAGLLTMGMGSLISYLGGMAFYGFGELIDRAISIDQKMM